MLHRLRILSRDDFLRHNIIFFGGSMLVAVLNYLYHPILSRMLSIEHFGETQVLFSLFVQASALHTVFGMVTLHVVANPSDERRAALRTFHRLAFGCTTTIATLLIISAPFLARTFRLSSSLGIILVAVALLFSVLNTFGNAHLQAGRRFTMLSIGNALSAGGKLGFAVLFVTLGWGTTGAIGGLLAAVITCAVYLWIHAGSAAMMPGGGGTWDRHLWNEIRYGIMIFCATGSIAVFSAADIGVVKYLFDPEIAGLYAGISTIARIIFFATGSVTGVLLSHVRLHHAQKENHRLLIKGLCMTALLGGGILVVMAFAPTLVIQTMIGQRYLAFAPLLPLLAIHTFVLALCNIFIAYYLALRRPIALTFGLVGLAVLSTSVAVFHTSPWQIVCGFLIGSVVMLAAFVIFSFVGSDERSLNNLNAPQALDQCGGPAL